MGALRKTDRRKEEQFPWDDANTAEMLRRWDKGQSATEIAKHLGGAATRNAVIGKIFRVRTRKPDCAGRGSTKVVWTSEKLAMLKAADGVDTLANIALAVGFPTTKVHAKANKLGIVLKSTFVKPKTVSVAQTRQADSGPPIIRKPGPEGGVDIMGLKYGLCRWPIGGSGAEMKSCGATCGERVYCKTHRKIAYEPRSKAQKRSAVRGTLWVADR